MQDYRQSNQEEIQEAIERFEELVKQEKESFFDVHQIESIFDFYDEGNQFEKAEEALMIGLRQHPESFSLLQKKSAVLVEKGKWDDALDILNWLVQIETSNPEIYLSMGTLYLLKEEEKFAFKHYTSALKFVTEEDERDFMFEIGFNLNQEGYFLEARNLLEKSHVKYPLDENILFELAFAYDKMEETENGIHTYNALLDLNPYLENAWYNLGILYNKKCEYHKAIEAYDFALSIDNTLREAYFNLGNSYAQIGEYREAINSYVEYISMGSGSRLTYFYLADCWENLENHDLASRFYEKVLCSDDKHLEALQGLGRTSFASRNYPKSLLAFDRALSINPENSEVWLYMGKAYTQLNTFSEAKRCFKRALLGRLDDTRNWLELYQFLESYENGFKAVPFLRKLLRKDNKNGALHYLASVIYYKANKKTDSLNHLVIAKQLQPDDLEIVLDEFPEIISHPEIAGYINDSNNL